MKTIPLLISLFIVIMSSAQGDPCLYLAYDGFQYSTNQPLNNLNGGSGWDQSWNVQNNVTSIPGFQSASSSSSLTYSNLQTTGTHASGGFEYLTAGRILDTDPNGIFSSYIDPNGGYIGSITGTDIWVSYLLNKVENNDEEVYVDMHNDPSIGWCNGCASQHIAAGYFGTHSNVAGQRRWTLKLNNNYYPTTVQLSPNTPTFIVMHISFNATNTNVSLYINPSQLGNNTPTPTLTQSITTPLEIAACAIYLGDNPGSGLIDEIRLAGSYACAAPDNTITINMPPQAVVTANTNQGQLPLNVTFNGSSSSDPEGDALTYIWNFGDGSPNTNETNPSHSYTNVSGLITVSLTVIDAQGLSNTAYYDLTIYDANGHFSCLPAVSCINMSTCGAADGRIRINTAHNFTLTNSANIVMPISNGNEYHNLALGTYHLQVTGANGCSDERDIFITNDDRICPEEPMQNCSIKVGTNMSLFADWAVERPMKNLFKHIRPEAIPYTDDCFCWYLPVSDEMSFDAQGYPLQIPQITSVGSTKIRYVLSSQSEDGTNLHINQDYVILYDGTGTVEVAGGANVISNINGRLVFSLLTNDANYSLNITSSSAADHIRNIRLLRIEDEFADLENDPFYDGFIAKIQPFEYLRFMDWQQTNQSALTTWDERTSVDYFTYGTANGVPYEIIIQLANQLQKDLWICIPHGANDNYINSMAQMFYNNLDPSLNVYLEYSNEVWNWIFPQSHYNVETAPSNLNYGRAYAEKSRNCFRIWKTVFGADGGRILRVLGLQATNTYLNEEILAQLPQAEWDYAAPTHYFGLNHDSGNPILNATSTPQDLVANARNFWLENNALLFQDYNDTKLYGKQIVTYEGGQHFVGNVFGVTYPYQQAMYDSQYTPEIYNLYREVMDSIRSWGCIAATNFNLASPQESVYGSWGVLNDIDIQPPYYNTAPKYQAMLDFIANPCGLMPCAFTPTITGSTNPCTNGSYSYSVTPITGSTYNWSVIGGTIISSMPYTNTIEVDWNNGTIGQVDITIIVP